METTIGFDPDSAAHGAAIYVNGSLVELSCMTTIEIYELLKSGKYNNITAHVEDNASNSSVFHQRLRKTDTLPVKLKKAQSVGMVKQAQNELTRMLEYLDIPIVYHKSSSEWKSTQGKGIFQRVTGWSGRSNKDSRSAAYFGYIGLNYKGIAKS